MPENTVYVGRPTKWGNPWSVHDEQYVEYVRQQVRVGKNRTRLENELRAQVVAQFKMWLLGNEELLSQLEELRGKDLACWCRWNDCCHADVLLELANREPSNE